MAIVYRHVYRQKTNPVNDGEDPHRLLRNYGSPSIANDQPKPHPALRLESTVAKPVTVRQCFIRRGAPAIPPGNLATFRPLLQLRLYKCGTTVRVEQSKLMADVISNLGQAYLEKTGAIEATPRH